MNLFDNLVKNQQDSASILSKIFNLAPKITNVINTSKIGEKFEIGQILSLFEIVAEAP